MKLVGVMCFTPYTLLRVVSTSIWRSFGARRSRQVFPLFLDKLIVSAERWSLMVEKSLPSRQLARKELFRLEDA
jgi:hypothetical protein